jgi:hypothetical protein
MLRQSRAEFVTRQRTDDAGAPPRAGLGKR